MDGPPKNLFTSDHTCFKLDQLYVVGFLLQLECVFSLQQEFLLLSVVIPFHSFQLVVQVATLVTIISADSIPNLLITLCVAYTKGFVIVSIICLTVKSGFFFNIGR